MAYRTATLLYLISPTAWALVPPDYQEPPSDFTAEIGAGLVLNTGNTQSSSFNGKTELVYDTLQTKQAAKFKANFASDDEKTTAEKYEVNLQSNYKLGGSNKGYILGLTDFTSDRFGSYTRIWTLSTGYGFNIIDSHETKLTLEVGPGYRYNLPLETETEPMPEAEKDVIIRTTIKFKQKLQEYTSLNTHIIAETGQNNNTLTLDINYKNTLFQDWTFNIGINVKYTDVVPEGSKQTDTTTTFTLLYTFQ